MDVKKFYNIGPRMKKKMVIQKTSMPVILENVSVQLSKTSMAAKHLNRLRRKVK